jgi:hypothetical protein
MSYDRTSGARSWWLHQRSWQPPSETCNVVFSCVLTLREGISSTSRDNLISYRYDMQLYCTFVLFVNQHFPGLPSSATHCIIGIATRIQSERSKNLGSILPASTGYFSRFHSLVTGSNAHQPLIQWTKEIFYWGMKLKNSIPSWGYKYFSTFLMACCLISTRNALTLMF